MEYIYFVSPGTGPTTSLRSFVGLQLGSGTLITVFYYCTCNVGIINPRRACARVTVVDVCVCVSVYLSVPALAASASVEDSKQRYSRVSLRLFLDFDSWIFEKPFRSKVIARKSQYANLIELTASRFRALSGPADCRNDNWSIEYCFRR